MRFLLFITLILFNFHAHAAISNWVQFSQDRGHIKIPVIVEGIETQAILDTGAQVHGINSAFILKNKLDLVAAGKTRVKGVYGIEDKKTYNKVNVSLFGFETQIDGLVAAQLGFHTNGLLLGAGFFDKFIVQLDYPNSRMRLITRDSLDLGKVENIKMRAQRGTGRPVVRVKLSEERSAWLLLDTGSSGGIMIKRSVADNLGWLDIKGIQYQPQSWGQLLCHHTISANRGIYFWAIYTGKCVGELSRRGTNRELRKSIFHYWHSHKISEGRRSTWL
ncbi:pepsin/retropepsin-like aspartic protease family protein [Pseudoalteromonas sp. GB56]